ncbi:hypothetical protein OG912_10270 [Streptomyces sp. NBC_00464]|uniref:hypothetical protein n=1 Tax=Streptomyces sp. NBC_00464 TaxID=2975751 RepID=UPI002E18C84D
MRTSSSPVAAGRFTRRAATGCLILLMLPAALLAYFWYSVWHAGHVNAQRKEAATAFVLAQARHASDSTSRALSSSRSTAPDALIGVIRRHTQAPVIVYDRAHGTYTATVSWSSFYTEEAILLAAGPIEVERCFTLTSVRTPRGTWETKPVERDRGACAPSRMISADVALAQKRIKTMAAEKVTRAEVARVLDPADQQRPYSVKRVRRSDEAVVVTVLVRENGDGTPVQQCYAFTRSLGADADAQPVTAVPVATC